MNNNLTDSEIIKALEGAILNAKSVDCKVWSIEVYKLENALDLINRQKAEIEKLTEENKKLSRYEGEILKEFAERLKENSISIFTSKGIVTVEGIDNLLNELVGE